MKNLDYPLVFERLIANEGLFMYFLGEVVWIYVNQSLYG